MCKKIKYIIGFLFLFLAACGRKNTEEQPSPTVTQAASNSSLQEIPEDAYEIRGNGNVVWTMGLSGSNGISEKNINALNEKLLEDGYDCTLSICTLDGNADHYAIISQMLEAGTTDIVTMNFGRKSSNMNEDDLMEEGKLEELSGYLSTQEGRLLWNAFYEEEWEAGRRDAGLYYIPNQSLTYGNGYMAFNREYFTEEELDVFDGRYLDLAALRKLLEAKTFPEDVYPLYWWNSMDKNADYIGYRFALGTFRDFETGTVYSPYEAERYKEYLKELHDMHQAGLLKNQETREERQEVISSGRFGVWLAGETDYLVETIRENVIYIPMPFAVSTYSTRHISVAKNSDNKDAALQLLTLLFTNPEYSNLLIYGVEGEDYQVADGYVFNMEGEAIDEYRNCYITGLYTQLLPSMEMYFASNRQELKAEFYNATLKGIDITRGFVADTSMIKTEVAAAGNAHMTDYADLWLKEDFEVAWEEAEAAWKAAGGQKVVDELNRQIQEWLNRE